jgi:hypothetical protein
VKAEANLFLKMEASLLTVVKAEASLLSGGEGGSQSFSCRWKPAFYLDVMAEANLFLKMEASRLPVGEGGSQSFP